MTKLTDTEQIYKYLHNKMMDLSYEEGLSHLSSCVTTLPILVDFYTTKQSNDLVILSNGHAGLAQYMCMEFFENKTSPKHLLHKHGIHPSKDKQEGIFCSTGSLGLGLPIAIGASIADPSRKVYCVISDGECFEGSIWESLYFLSRNNIPNLFVSVNANGICAYNHINIQKLKKIIQGFDCNNVQVVDTSDYLKRFPTLATKGIESHYVKIVNETSLKGLKYEI
jgi:transketolase N-terminal domain/subunit